MRLYLTIFFLILTNNCFSQKSTKNKEYLVKFYIADSIIQFKTTNVDTIRNKSEGDLPYVDSLESYRNRQLDGPKIIYNGVVTERKEYKKGKLLSEKYYEKDGTLVYDSKLDSTKLEKTIFKLANGKKFLSYSTSDTLIILNKSIPLLNLQVSFSGKGGLTHQALGQLSGGYNYILTPSLPAPSFNEVKIEVITLIDGLSKIKKHRIETFIIPVK